MPRFPGLSKVDDSFRLPWRDDGGGILNLGFGQNGQPRRTFDLPDMHPVRDWTALSVATGTQTPDAVVDAPNPPGASRPDLIVVPGAAASGGGLTIGSLAILALLGVGGWFLYKRFAK